MGNDSAAAGDTVSPSPKYRQVAVYIKNYIKNGCFAPGTKLPGGRKFADIFKVSKNTVYEAMSILESDGIIDISSQSGAYVAKDAWHGLAAESPSWERYVNNGWQKSIGSHFKEICRFIGNDSDIYLSSTGLDPCFGFNGIVAESVNRVSEKIRSDNILNSYHARGPYALRCAVSEHLALKGIKAPPESIIITPSMSISIDVINRALLNPGNTAYISEQIPAFLFSVLNSIGVEIVPVPIDGEGMSVNALKKLMKSPKKPLIITAASFPNDTGETMSMERREELLMFCRRFRYPVVELDSFSDLAPDAPPPLKALDDCNSVIYVGSMPNYMYLGINVSWIAAPDHLNDRLTDVIAQCYHYPFNINYFLVEDLLSGGGYVSFLKKFIPAMRRRMAVVDGFLESYAAPFVKWNQNARYGLFLLTLDSPAVVKKISDEGAGILFVSDIKLKSIDNSHIYLYTCGLSEEKLRSGLEILGCLLYGCSISA